MKKIVRLIRKFIKLSFKRKLLFIEAYFLLGYWRLMILKKPFLKIADSLGTQNVETPVSCEDIDLKTVRQVKSAIKAMSKYTFWESKCLVQAYAAKAMLRKRKQKTTVYLGVAKSENKEMIAHAWVRCGTVYVTGGNERERFTVTSIFGDE